MKILRPEEDRNLNDCDHRKRMNCIASHHCTSDPLSLHLHPELQRACQSTTEYHRKRRYPVLRLTPGSQEHSSRRPQTGRAAAHVCDDHGSMLVSGQHAGADRLPGSRVALMPMLSARPTFLCSDRCLSRSLGVRPRRGRGAGLCA